MVMLLIVHLHSHGAVMHAHLAEDPTLNEKMNVLIYSSQRDSWNLLLNPGEDLLRAWMALHALHHLVQNLTLVGHGDSVLSTKLPET
jgi:hypothetical protein